MSPIVVLNTVAFILGLPRWIVLKFYVQVAMNVVMQTVTAPLTELVRIILSGLARITLERRFSCGKTLLAQVLCGSNSSRISELNLNTITTYGKLQCYKQKEVVPMIEALMNCGLIRQEKAGSGQFQVPVLALTDLGRDVMRGTRPLEVVPPFPRPDRKSVV